MYQPEAQPSYVLPLPPLMAFSKMEPNDMMDNMSANSSKKRSFESDSPVDDDKVLTEEDKVAKKQRRLVKNREAAAQFRHRQKAYMQKLEKHAEDLTLSNVQVTAKIELLDTENKLMKEQLNYLRNFMKQAVALSFPGNTTLPSLPPDSVVPPDPVSHSTPLVPSLPVIPDLFPGSPNEAKATSVPVKPEPPGAGSLVPDITNPATISTPSPTAPSTTTFNPIIITQTPTNPSIHSNHATVASMAPPTTVPSHMKPQHPIMSSTGFTDPFGSSSSSLGTSSSLSLSSVFNNMLGTDLSFSGVLVKSEPSYDESAQPQP